MISAFGCYIIPAIFFSAIGAFIFLYKCCFYLCCRSILLVQLHALVEYETIEAAEKAVSFSQYIFILSLSLYCLDQKLSLYRSNAGLGGYVQ